jgi:biotin carboxylase
MQVAHEGGIFVTQTLPEDDVAVAPLRAMNAHVLNSFGLRQGVSHTEFIRSITGEWYFLETSARVGGAFIVDMIEAATGVNLWREWARVEIAGEEGTYGPPRSKGAHAGIVLSLARQEHPDTSAYTAPEIVRRIDKRHHVGVIFASSRPERITELIDEHVTRFYSDFHASAPAPDRPVE